MTLRLRDRSAALAMLRVTGMALSTFLLILASRVLTPAETGVFVFFLAVLTTASACSSGGLLSYWTRFAAGESLALKADTDKVEVAESFASSIIWVFISSLVIVFIVLLLWSFFAVDLPNPSVPLALGLVFSSVLPFASALLRAGDRILMAEIPSTVFVPGFTLLILLAFLLMGATVSSTVFGFAYVTSFSFAALFALLSARSYSIFKWPAELNISHVYRWTLGFAPFVVLSAASVLLSQLPTLILGFLQESHEVATYKVADRVAAFVSFPLIVMNSVAAAEVARSAGQKNFEKVKSSFHRIRGWGLLAASVIALTFVVFGQELIGFVFGPAYSQSTFVCLLILIIANIINVYFGPVGMVLTMVGEEKAVAKEQLIALGVLTSVSLPTSAFFGPVGAAAGFLVSTAVWNFRLSFKYKTWSNLMSDGRRV